MAAASPVFCRAIVAILFAVTAVAMAGVPASALASDQSHKEEGAVILPGPLCELLIPGHDRLALVEGSLVYQGGMFPFARKTSGFTLNGRGYRYFAVSGSDPHNFDGDHDGIGCES